MFKYESCNLRCSEKVDKQLMHTMQKIDTQMSLLKNCICDFDWTLVILYMSILKQ